MHTYNIADARAGAAEATCAFLHPRVALLLVLVIEVFGQTGAQRLAVH